MDTTSSSFNTLDQDEFIEQIPCVAHLLSLHMHHAIERCSQLNDLFHSLQSLMAKLKGNKSPKRKALIEINVKKTISLLRLQKFL
jgi:hypothetical protein